MNSLQFLATNVARAVDSQPFKNPTDPTHNKDDNLHDNNSTNGSDYTDADIVARPIGPDTGSANNNDEGAQIQRSYFVMFAKALFFFPNLLIVTPVMFVLLLILFPFRLIASWIFASSTDPVNESTFDDADTELSPLVSPSPATVSPQGYSTGITTITEDDIEFDPIPAHTQVPDDDQLKSPTTVPYKISSSSSSAVEPKRRKSRFLFPRLLINNSFSIESPPAMPKKTLVLDLDETLIHSLSRHNSSVLSKSKGTMVEIRLSNQMSTLYYIYKRPFVEEFLAIVRRWFNLVCFTASIREYADPVIDFLESEVLLRSGSDRDFVNTKVFSKRYYRNNCLFEEGKGYIKDLDALITRTRPRPQNKSSEELGASTQEEAADLSKVIIIDNSPISYSRHRDNGIMVEGWINDPNDMELMNLLPLLNSLRFTSDVRSILSLKEGQAAFDG